MKSEVCLFFYRNQNSIEYTYRERERKKQIKAKSKFLPRVVITIMKKKKTENLIDSCASAVAELQRLFQIGTVIQWLAAGEYKALRE